MIDVIKNSTCYKAFTIFAEVPEIFMQQFWYTIKKVSITNSYEFLLANKKCLVDAEVFHKILDICPRVKGLKKGRRENMPYPGSPKSLSITSSPNTNPLPSYSTYTPTQLKMTVLGKGLQEKKTVDTYETDVGVSNESSSEPLGKSISLTKAAEEESTRQVHATHARIVTESILEPAKRRPSEQLDVEIMKALKENTSSKGTGTKPGVLDEEKVTSKVNVILDWGSEQESEYSKEDDDENINWVDTDEEEEKDDVDDDKSIDLEKTDDEETDDEFVHSEENVHDDVEQVNDDEDEKMTNAKDADIGNGDKEITDSGKVDAEKTEVEKDDIIKAKLPPTSSSLFVSSGFAVNAFLGSSMGDSFQKVLQKHMKELMQKYPRQVGYKEMIEESVQHQDLFDALMNSILLDDAIAHGQVDPEKVLRKRERDDEDPSAGPNQGKKTKRSRTKESEPSNKSSTSKESSKGKSLAKTSKSGKSVTAEEPTKDKDPKKDWFKQTPRPSTHDQEGNKRQVIVDQPKQPWFNNMVFVLKDSLTFNELMVTLIDFSNYTMNRLKIDNLTQAHLVGPDYELVKGTCTSSIELGYNMEECFKALTDKLDWNNPEDRFPFDLTKPLPLKGRVIPKSWIYYIR
nr:hypothetical protein [Tanacetum cinerariifolium]